MTGLRSRSTGLMTALQAFCLAATILAGLGLPVVVYLNLFGTQGLPDWTWNEGRDSVPGILVYLACWAGSFVAIMALSVMKSVVART